MMLNIFISKQQLEYKQPTFNYLIETEKLFSLCIEIATVRMIDTPAHTHKHTLL